MKEEYLLKSPCDFVRNLSVDKKQPAFWSEADIEKFQKISFGNKYYDLFMIALNTGMRKSELSGLCWDRVSFDENTITVSRQRDRNEFKERTKTNHIRTIPMNIICREILLKLQRQNIYLSKFVFLDNKNEPIEPHHICRVMTKLQIQAGIKTRIRFHDLRHTFASQYVRSGRNIYDLQKLLGHSSVAMTEGYAHHSKEHIQESIKGFELGSL